MREGEGSNAMSVAALIVAGGKSRRISADTPKQFCRLAEKPLINYSLEAFESWDEISSMVVVLPPEYSQVLQVRIDLKPFQKIREIVAGGELRQDSVISGLEALPGDAEYVVIQDGARPFPPIEATREALAAARECGAAILAVPVSDTVKRAAPEGYIRSTLERDELWLAQTPQVFRKNLIMEGYRVVREKKITVTDDAAALEIIGKPVRLIRGSPYNIKITYKEDFEIAARILRGTKEGERF